mmetsp:Transcript_10265/g.18784  ORF Transcript_10265/g.18784 Transcript_10265/m.18784 type:complete len:179 (+) Transcript_10265:715-1251(+)
MRVSLVCVCVYGRINSGGCAGEADREQQQQSELEGKHRWDEMISIFFTHQKDSSGWYHVWCLFRNVAPLHFTFYLYLIWYIIPFHKTITYTTSASNWLYCPTMHLSLATKKRSLWTSHPPTLPRKCTWATSAPPSSGTRSPTSSPSPATTSSDSTTWATGERSSACSWNTFATSSPPR